MRSRTSQGWWWGATAKGATPAPWQMLGRFLADAFGSVLPKPLRAARKNKKEKEKEEKMKRPIVHFCTLYKNPHSSGKLCDIATHRGYELYTYGGLKWCRLRRATYTIPAVWGLRTLESSRPDTPILGSIFGQFPISSLKTDASESKAEHPVIKEGFRNPSIP